MDGKLTTRATCSLSTRIMLVSGKARVWCDNPLDCAYLRKLGWLGFWTFGTELPGICAGVDGSIGDGSLMMGVGVCHVFNLGTAQAQGLGMVLGLARKNVPPQEIV
jgi:hypothetical protein